MSLDKRQIGAREQFNRQSRNYGKSHILADTSDVAKALSSIESLLAGSALDVATGAGHTALCLAELGWEVTACDLSAKMIELVREAAAERGYSIQTAVHEAEKLPYADHSFHLVTCRVAAHHFSDAGAFVREAKRVLVPGGVFLLIDGSVPDHEPEAAEWLHQVEKFRDPSHGRLFSPGAWKELCEQAGLNVLQCETFPFKQPDLEWYFQTAGTSEENRTRVLDLIQNAPESARRIFRLAEEDGKIVWWWPRLTLIARSPGDLSA